MTGQPEPLHHRAITSWPPARDRELEFIEFHRAWIKATEQPFDSRKPLPRALRSLAAAAFGLRLPNAVRKPRKVRFPESSPEPRLVADRSASAALALQAVAHGDARWFALNRKVKLPAAAGGASGHGSAPWLSV